MNEGKRKIGEYTVLCSVNVGEKEVILASKEQSTNGDKFKLRPGGVMALVTSKGTMDKENSNVRKYIAQRAELLGAIRLPNDTFKGNAGTEVVSDIPVSYTHLRAHET